MNSITANSHAIGVDIGGTNLRFALVCSSGEIVHRSRTVSRIDQGRDAFCSRLLEGIIAMREFAGGIGLSVAGVGVGVPGLVDNRGLVHSSVNMRPLDGFNLTAYLGQQTGLPVVCGNDANYIAMGEYIYGAGRGLDSFAVITIGTGLGSGLVLGGRLWTGAGGFAAEFGHVTVEPEGIPCFCGNRGCLEQYVSAGAIVRVARHLFGDEDVGIGPLSTKHVAEMARQGRNAAVVAFESAGRYLGIALASLVNVLDLEAIVIGGGVAGSLDLILPALLNELKRRCFPQIAENVSILAGKLGDDAGLLGATAVLLGDMAS